MQAISGDVKCLGASVCASVLVATCRCVVLEGVNVRAFSFGR